MKKNSRIDYLKNEKGITLAVLIITVIVVIILSAVTIKIGTDSTGSTRLQGFYTQLEIIQKRVDAVAATNENYVDSNGNTIYLKEKGQDLTAEQTTRLTSILNAENIEAPVSNFRYFTIQELENVLDLIEMEYNVFIDFDNRIVVAEDGIKIDNQTYYVLENSTYFVQQNTSKNEGTIQSLSYQVMQYGNRYKVTVTPSNTVGDLTNIGHVQYKKATSKYWEISNNNEIIVEQSVEYHVMYQDANKNTIQRTIKVELDASGLPTVQEV